MLLLSVTHLFGFNWNLSLTSRWGEGNQLGVRYHYLENYLGFSSFQGSWQLQGDLVYNQPPEYGLEQTGLRQFQLNYLGDRLSVEAGYLAEVYGSGMSLNLFEDKGIDFNNMPLGLKLDWRQSPQARWTGFLAKKSPYHFYSPSSNNRQPDGSADYLLGGLKAEFSNLSENQKVIPYLVISRFQSPIQDYAVNASTDQVVIDTLNQKMAVSTAGLAMAVYRDSWDLFLETAWTEKTFDQPLRNQRVIITDQTWGVFTDALLTRVAAYSIFGRTNVYLKDISLMVEYKNYQLGVESDDDKTNPYQLATKAMPYQVGPTGLRQHDISLLGTITHPIDYGDEVGFYMELQWPLNFDWTLRSNASILSTANSRHQTTGLLLDPKPIAMPTFDQRYAPFQEYQAEIAYAGSKLNYRGVLAFTTSTISGQMNEIGRYITMVPGYVSYRVGQWLVLGSVMEVQHAKIHSENQSGQNLGGFDYLSYHQIFSLDWAAKYSLALIWDETNDPTQVDQSGTPIRNWVSGELTLRPSERFQLRASYGSEKGGVRCTGGVCRVVNPFHGARLTLEVRI